jgi:broad specificity phosphatase PhoE
VRLIWIRHGETNGNAAKRYIGHLDEPLNRRGQAQVRRLIKRLSEYPIDALYSSDLKRCLETARICLSVWGDAPWVKTPALRECSFGKWEGLTYREIEAQAPDLLEKWLDDPFRFAPPQGESLTDLDRRLSRWLEGIERTETGQTLAICSHGGPIRWFLAKQVEMDWTRFWHLVVPHGGAWIVEKKGDRWEIVNSIG